MRVHLVVSTFVLWHPSLCSIVPVFINDVFCAFARQLNRRSAEQASMNSHAESLVVDEASVVRTVAPWVYTLLAQGVQAPIARVLMRGAPALQHDTSLHTFQFFLVVGRIMRGWDVVFAMRARILSGKLVIDGVIRDCLFFLLSAP